MADREDPPTGFPEPPDDAGAARRDEPPHHALSNPVGEPDPTEYPDPYETRPDPRDPEHPDVAAGQEPSTSEPHPPRNRDEELGRSDE
jgi:hypothetical protein